MGGVEAWHDPKPEATAAVLSDDVVFLLDVDNTLLDNDRFGADLGDRLEQAFGRDGRERYWAIFTALREEFGIADYLGSLQAFRTGLDDDPQLLHMSEYLLEYPFADVGLSAGVGRHRPSAWASWAGRWCCRTATWCSSRAKIQRAGIWDAVERPGAHLPAQGTGVGPRAAALSGVALCDGRRQAESAGCDEEHPRREADHGIRAPGALRAGRGVEHRATAARSGDRAHRRPVDSQSIRLRGATT